MKAKWFHFASATLVTVFGAIAAADWSSVLSPQAASLVVVGLGAAKMIVSSLSANQDALK